MKNVVETRLLHLKKHWFSLLFWLLLPLIVTLAISTVLSNVQDDSRIPIGIVIENSNEPTIELLNEIATTTFVNVQQLSEKEALYQLRKHQLDSVFVIHNDFASQIRAGNRSHIITSYRTNQSLAYTPVKEMILSYVQQETGRSKAAYIIRELTESYQMESEWTWKQVIEKSKEIQEEESLLQTTFSFNGGNSQTVENISIWNTLALWSIFSMLSTLLIFDWVVKENHSKVTLRFAFTTISLKGYLTRNLIFYSILLTIMDSVAMYVFELLQYVQLDSQIIIGVIYYRFILILGAFLLALLFKNSYKYYVSSFAIVLFCMISSGAILPMNGLLLRWPLLSTINPTTPIVSSEFINFWPGFLLITFIIWIVRKERYYA
ncbi:ABC transporter permease [Virgibacillus sp. DJP39]|uniref:ABC transporter permease n=1 Tax=Virgibacillus sp. DJP39 TaxID=3409790 RepID=UPI003BB6AD32